MKQIKFLTRWGMISFLVLACSSTQKPVATQEKSSPLQVSKVDETFRRLIASPLFEVCSKMETYGKRLQERTSAEEKPKQTLRSLIQISALSPTVEYQFRVPAFHDFTTWTSTVGDDYRKHPEYKAEAEKAFAAHEKALPEAKRVDYHSYHALILARAMNARPKLLVNDDIRHTCKYIESSMIKNLDAELPRMMTELLARLKISPKEVGFDSKWQSQVTVTYLPDPRFQNTIWESVTFPKK